MQAQSVAPSPASATGRLDYGGMLAAVASADPGLLRTAVLSMVQHERQERERGIPSLGTAFLSAYLLHGQG